MASKRQPSSSAGRTINRAPATTPEAQEQRLIDLAQSLAERQMADGSVSSQVQTHYLKLGSTREKLEQQRLENENALLRAKVESMESARNVEALLEDALEAFRAYSPSPEQDPFDD